MLYDLHLINISLLIVHVNLCSYTMVYSSTEQELYIFACYDIKQGIIATE